ncbi:MAG: 2-hydroxyacid dehydrogenase [Spirochaetaceae bacterium]|jgi:D-lactate dehydrogenase|nr:2-hydroxyacid dehydrogenase [Spirochaetaceae bacterium]
MEKYKIAFFDAKPYDYDYFVPLAKNTALEIKFLETNLNPTTALLANGCDAVCLFCNDVLNAEIADIFFGQGIKLISLRSAGFNNVDLNAIHGRIPVVNVPAYSPHAVAEYALALLLTLNRKTHKAYARTRDGNFSLVGLEGFDLCGKTTGIIGTGKIGRIAAEICRGFGMNVLAFDPYPQQEWADAHGIRFVNIKDLLRQSDIISLHCPLTAENKHLINSEAIASMKPGVFIINTGRGGLIDTGALIKGLKSKQIGAAGLDVYEEEDGYFFEDHSGEVIQDDTLVRLMSFPNVLVTSHQAFFTKEALTAIAKTTIENCLAFFERHELPNEVKLH